LAASLAGSGMVVFGQGTTRPAPPLQMVLHNGSFFDLAKEKGNVVLLEVLLTHCPACQASARLLSGMLPDYAPKGVKFVGMAINADAALQIQDFVSTHAKVFPVGIKNLTFAQEFLQFSAVRNMLMPRLVFVDRKGMIRAHYGAEEEWMNPKVEEQNIRTLLNKLVAEPGGTAAAKSTAAKPAAKK